MGTPVLIFAVSFVLTWVALRVRSKGVFIGGMVVLVGLVTLHCLIASGVVVWPFTWLAI
ncbi:MAG TPA: hypothetical protein VHE33_21445 [Acidobacteriaceae bacterium]|nr:hypothetical protein [Acidobacteriaceae bacterium]